SVPINCAFHLNRSSAASRKALTVLRDFFAFTSKVLSVLIDREIKADFHVSVGFISCLLDGVDDLPITREIGNIRSTFFIFRFRRRRSSLNGSFGSWPKRCRRVPSVEPLYKHDRSHTDNKH